MNKKHTKQLDYAFDKHHIWHPYTSLTDPLPVYGVVGANGCLLELDDGSTLIDGMSSWWSALHGYNHPVLNQAMKDQIDKMSHVMFGGITHQPAIDLCKRLVTLTPEGLDKVFLADSGSVSVEVAFKMALQYWHSQGKPQKQRMLTLKNGYHGDTFAAMSVCDPVTGMHSLFGDVVQTQLFIERPSIRFDEPWQDKDCDELKQVLKTHHKHIAALILEPIVQGTGGMHFYHPEYLKQARLLCDQYGVLLIADEIATGFGRTGKLFACEWAEITPDIMCVGKALTGGTMTLAATLTTQNIAESICNGEAGVFMHGPTFMGNPLACATAVASIDLLLDSPWQANIKHINNLLNEGLASLACHAKVKHIRTLGAIGVVETKQPVDVVEIQKFCVANGVWLRPFGCLLYIMPPFIASKKQVERLCEVVRAYFEDA